MPGETCLPPSSFLLHLPLKIKLDNVGHCFLRTMAAAHHSTRTSFFRCLSPFQETGLLEPTPYNKRSSSSFHPYPPLSLSFSISDIPALFSSGLIARAVSRILHESDRESVELRRFFGVIHTDRKSTTMVSFHFQNVVRERKKLVGHRFSLFLSLSR